MTTRTASISWSDSFVATHFHQPGGQEAHLIIRLIYLDKNRHKQ